MQFGKRLFLSFLIFLAVVAGAAVWLESRYMLPVIMYHNVAENPQGRNDTVGPENFRKQIAYIKRQGYKVLPLSELAELIRAGKKLPRRAVVLTFDDGYENNFSQAFPILKASGFPATFFVSSERVGKPGYMNWEQLYVLRDTGLDIQSHGMSEDYLPNVPADRQRYEIFESKRVLAERLNKPIDYYAYSIGGFNESIREMVIAAGYKGAVATNRGLHRRPDAYEIRRIKFSDRDNSDAILGWKLSGYYNAFRRVKSPN